MGRGVGRNGKDTVNKLTLNILSLKCPWVIQEELFRRFLTIGVWSLRERYIQTRARYIVLVTQLSSVLLPIMME